MSLPNDLWNQARSAYIRGEGSFARVADRFGIRLGTLERRAGKEKWYALRAQRQQARIAQLTAPEPVRLPHVQPESVPEDPIEAFRVKHFRENGYLVQGIRAEIIKRLATPELISPGDMGKLARTLDQLQRLEARLIEAARKERPRRREPTYEIPADSSSEVAFEGFTEGSSDDSTGLT